LIIRFFKLETNSGNKRMQSYKHQPKSALESTSQFFKDVISSGNKTLKNNKPM
jgi:hypothetical protein